jgi:RNA polymerase sigma-70 factor (ECF subfamily)
MVDLDSGWESDEPSPERITAARLEVARVQAALDTLTERARRIFIMRKVEGMAQKDIARALDVSEAVVENDASRSLRAVLRVLSGGEDTAADATGGSHERVRSR